MFQPIPIKRSIAGYFAEGRWTAATRVAVTGGLRLEDIRRERLEESPDAVLSAAGVADDSVVSVNPKAGRGVDRARRAADVTQAARLGRNRHPSARRIRPRVHRQSVAETGAQPQRRGRHRADVRGRTRRAEAVAFFNDYDDLIVAVGSFRESSRYTTDNISNARARGLELGARRRASARVAARPRPARARRRTRCSTPRCSPWIATTRRRRRSRLAIRSFAVRAISSPPSVTGTTGPLTLFLTGGARSRVLDVEPSLGTFGGLYYATASTRGTPARRGALRRIGEVFGRVENLFDRNYEEALGFPALGRRATIGLRVAAGR